MVNIAALAVALPLYSWPAPGAWKPIYQVIASNPNTTFDIIVNPSTGPGDFPPDPQYIAGVSKLNSYSNVRAFGYLHTSYTERPIQDVQNDIRTYSRWETYGAANLHLAGIFVDEAPQATSGLHYMTQVAHSIRGNMPAGTKVWTNPGCIVSEAFYEHADIVTAFEDEYETWISPNRDPIPSTLHSKSNVIINKFNGADRDIASEAQVIKGREFQSACLIGASGYQAYSTAWADFAAVVHG